MVLYKFYKPGCSPCSTMKKIMAHIPLPTGVELVEIDVTDEQYAELVERCNISAVPSLAYETGDVLVGVKPKSALEDWIYQHGN